MNPSGLMLHQIFQQNAACITYRHVNANKKCYKIFVLHGLVTVILLQIIFSITASAQQSNLYEDYSAYLPEVRNFNKFIFHLPPSPSILTKEGLEKEETK